MRSLKDTLRAAATATAMGAGLMALKPDSDTDRPTHMKGKGNFKTNTLILEGNHFDVCFSSRLENKFSYFSQENFIFAQRKCF